MSATVTQRAEPAVARATAQRFGTWYVTEHNLRRLKNYGWTVVATAFGTPLLYLFAFGVGLATLITQNRGEGAVAGVDYLVFVAPALLCTAAVTVASEEFTYTIMMGFKWNPIFFAMNAAPLQPFQIVNGVILFVAIRMTVTCAIYFAIVAAFGAVQSPAGVLGIAIAVLGGLAFGTPLMAYSASLTEDRGQFAMVMRFIVVPMTLFSGTMFPLTQLPVGLQWIGWISPLWHSTELARVASYGMTEPVWLSVVHVVYLVALATVGWVLAARITARRLNK